MTCARQSTEDTPYSLYSDTSVDGMDWGSGLLADMCGGYVVPEGLNDGSHRDWDVSNAVDEHDFGRTPVTYKLPPAPLGFYSL